MAYYLPLSTGSVKKWGSETEDFWCCHCTLLQANAFHHRAIYYQDGDVLTAAQYLPSETSFDIDGHRVHVRQTEGVSADTIRITPEAYTQHERPEYTDMVFQIDCD